MNAPDTKLSTAGMAVSPQVLTIYGQGYADLPPNAVVNEYAALSVPAFYSGVRFICETLAGLPKAVYRESADVKQPVKHAVTRLLSQKINGVTIPFVVWETLYHHAVIFGNGYLWIKRDSTFGPAALYNINPENVTPFRFTPEGETEPQQWFFIRGGGPDGKGLVLPGADVIHIPGLGFDGMCGYPIVYLLATTFEWARNASKFSQDFFKNGTKTAGSIEVPGSMTTDQIAQMRHEIQKNHAGPQNGMNHLLLTGGATLKSNMVPQEQSQFLQTMNFSVTDFCRILRIPPHVVYQLDRATWANIETLGIEVVKYSLRAWIEKTEEELSSKLLTTAELNDDLTIVFAVDNLMRGDTQTLSQTTIAEVNAGLRTANEGRKTLGLPPDPDPAANKLRVPINFPVPGMEPVPTAAPGKTVALPPAAAPATPKRKKNSRDVSPPDTFTAFMPVVLEACTRVEAKTDKAFANKADKPRAEFVPWGNVFAAEQEQYTRAALAPIALAVGSTSGRAIPVEKIATRYSAALRKRAADGTVKTLSTILEESINEPA